ncbi:MAG: hypothetical protein KA314_17310 [Chloroflexi bacterium]|nr:hypothetical protein [Chloroflexota bacterium]MBP8057591.1 hypothetical protein [Chloroflexota bacterium]
MSIQLIQQYHSKVERLIRYGGTRKETTVRKPFMDLLEHYARPRNLELVPEVEYRTRSGHTVYPDGTLKDALRQDWSMVLLTRQVNLNLCQPRGRNSPPLPPHPRYPAPWSPQYPHRRGRGAGGSFHSGNKPCGWLHYDDRRHRCLPL